MGNSGHTRGAPEVRGQGEADGKGKGRFLQRARGGFILKAIHFKYIFNQRLDTANFHTGHVEDRRGAVGVGRRR